MELVMKDSLVEAVLVCLVISGTLGIIPNRGVMVLGPVSSQRRGFIIILSVAYVCLRPICLFFAKVWGFCKV